MQGKFGFLSYRAWHQESRVLLKLALPILLAQLALTGLGVVDTIMSGHVGTFDLAAIGLGSNILLPVFIFTMGVLLAITPMVSKANGQNLAQSEAHTDSPLPDPNIVDKLPNQPLPLGLYLVQGLWLALPLGLLSAVLVMNFEWLLLRLDIEPQVFQLTQDYLFYSAFGLPAIALYQVFRFFWEGLGISLPTMWISFAALLLNIPLNAVFIYGFGPIDAMGAVGCGVASALVMWSMLMLAVIYVFKKPRLYAHLLPLTLTKMKPHWLLGLKPILALGIPNSFALLFEVGLFSFIALFVASLGATVIAAHQIAISFTSVAFMFPLSFAMALTVRVGYGLGKQQRSHVLLSLFTGFSWALVIGGGLSLLSFFWRTEIVAIYSYEPHVTQLAATLLVFAAMYQIFDAIQVSAAGALRGFHDTRITMWVTLVSYWGVGLGLGYVFTFSNLVVTSMGVQGFWLGIVLGLGLAAILLSWRLKRVFDGYFRSPI